MKSYSELEQEQLTRVPVSIPEAPAIEDAGKLVLRLSLGGMMLFHGIAKMMFGIDPIMNMVVAAGLPQFVAYGVYVGEVLGPVMLIVGLYTRFAAMAVAIDMIVATVMVHMGDVMRLG